MVIGWIFIVFTPAGFIGVSLLTWPVWYLPPRSFCLVSAEEGSNVHGWAVSCLMALERIQQGLKTSGAQSMVRSRERLKAISCWRFSGSAEEMEMLADGQHTNKTGEEEPQ